MSANILNDLIGSLSEKQGNEKMTNEEAQLIMQWKSQTIKTCVIQASAATALISFATRKLNAFNRLTLSGGAGFLTVASRLHNSLDVFVDSILGMEGTRLQHQLKNIILERFGNDPEMMKLYSKHFYCEEVFNDFEPGHPVPIYRPRSLYGDDQLTSNDKTSQESVKKGVYHEERKNDFNVKLKNGVAPNKQVPMNPGLRALGYGDPLEVLFGHSPPSEELPHPDESRKSVKVQTHSQRKARRKHRARHRHQESLAMDAPGA